MNKDKYSRSLALKLLRNSPWSVKTLCKHGLPSKYIFYNSGIGDDLLCTTVARELKKRGERNIWLGTNYPDIFSLNKDIETVSNVDWRYARLSVIMGCKIQPLWYTQYQSNEDMDPEPPRHFASMMCEKAGLKGEIYLRPYCFLGEKETENGQITKQQISVQTTSLGAGTPLLNKEWFPQRFGEVAAQLSKNFTLVQIGTKNDPKVPSALDMRGKTTIRQAASILYSSRLFIGLAGGLMHLARAVDCPSVIVYGGREQPEISGYPCNKNLVSKFDCSPCWKRNICEFDRKCMRDIEVLDVLTAVEKMLARDRHPLKVAKDYIE